MLCDSIAMAKPDIKIASAMERLRKTLSDEFALAIVAGAERSVADCENPLRVNFFATAMRILFEHSMDTLSPTKEVKKCTWYKPERENGEPTRKQRVTFAVQGGLTDEFVVDKLGVDLAPLHKSLRESVDALCKQIHGRMDTIITDPVEQDVFIALAADAMTEFFTTLDACRKNIVEPISDHLDGTAVDALTSETLLDVDELASHYTLEEVYVEKTTVHRIGAESITYRAEGTLSVGLQWGSNSDVRNGDGAELDQDFPFHCDIEVPIDDPWNLEYSETSYGVDTSEWREAMEPDEEDR